MPPSCSPADPEPAPLRQVLLKVHSRCNLACDHCYVYRGADQSWRRQPVRMTRATIDRAAGRIAEHAREHQLPRVRVILHGGEPLLAGAALIEYAALALRAAVPAGTEVAITVQTNGLLLDTALLNLFQRYGITVGVSLDGGRTANDRHRVFAGGRGSYDQVAPRLRLLASERYRSCYAGLLCTVDLANDPIDVYDDLIAFAPPRLDLLLPHGNHTAPPPGRPANGERSGYADWLIAIFDRWYGAPRRETRIRLFESIMDLLLGLPSRSEAVGLGRVDLVTVETDGSLEQVDSLKTTAPGIAATGLNLSVDTLDDALAHPGIQARQRGLDALSAQCRSCDLVRVCGGGLYPHRYRAGSGFANPSVYCPDLYALITHVRARLVADLARHARKGAPSTQDGAPSAMGR